MNNFKYFGLSTLLVALTAVFTVSPSFADSASTNSTQTVNTTVVSSPVKTTPNLSSINLNKSVPNQITDSISTTQEPVTVHVPVGTSQVIIKCLSPQVSHNNPSLIPQGPGPVLPNPTMPAYKDMIVSTDGFHTPVIETFCPVRIVYDAKVRPILPGLGSNVTFSIPAPNFLGNEIKDFYYPIYPRGVNPSRKGLDNAIGGNNSDFDYWPNPSSVPSNVQVTVSGVFKSTDQINQVATSIVGTKAITVLSGVIDQLRHPQQTLAHLHQIEANLQSQTFQASEKLWIEGAIYASILQPKKLDINLYLVSFPTTNIFSLRSPFVPVSPSNSQGYWPNPQPSANVLVDSSGYYLNGEQGKSLNPLVDLIPVVDGKPVNGATPTEVKIGNYVTYEPNTGSYKFPENTVPATRQANSPFAVYYVNNKDLEVIISKLK